MEYDQEIWKEIERTYGGLDSGFRRMEKNRRV